MLFQRVEKLSVKADRTQSLGKIPQREQTENKKIIRDACNIEYILAEFVYKIYKYILKKGVQKKIQAYRTTRLQE